MAASKKSLEERFSITKQTAINFQEGQLSKNSQMG
jgi:hypothetical protein